MQNVDKKNESEHSSTQRGSYEKPICRSTCCERRDREIYLARDSNLQPSYGKKQQEFTTLSSPFRGHKDVDEKVEELLWMSKADKKKVGGALQ
jgi:hypothetical protein